MIATPNVPVISSLLLSRHADLVFGMSTRRGGVSPEPLGMNLSYSVGDEKSNVQRNREIFFHTLGIPLERLSFTQQIHGDNILPVRSPGQFESCDALITNQPDVYLTVSIADCVPIVMYDPVGKSVAAVHAGWRGTKAVIAKKALHLLKENFHSQAKDVIVYIGPSASVCCYEIGAEVEGEFDKKFVRKSHDGKAYLDLKSVNKDLLLIEGVKEENLEVSPLCTICGSDLFHSFRRDGKKSGRMFGVIGMRS